LRYRVVAAVLVFGGKQKFTAICFNSMEVARFLKLIQFGALNGVLSCAGMLVGCRQLEYKRWKIISGSEKSFWVWYRTRLPCSMESIDKQSPFAFFNMDLLIWFV
jgi:hypothetical protein